MPVTSALPYTLFNKISTQVLAVSFLQNTRQRPPTVRCLAMLRAEIQFIKRKNTLTAIGKGTPTLTHVSGYNICGNKNFQFAV